MSKQGSPGSALLWSPQLVTRIPMADDAREAITEAGKPLVDLEAVDAQFISAVTAQERSSPSVVPAEVPFALARGVRGALRPAAAVGVLKTPTPFLPSGAWEDADPIDVRIVAIASAPPGSELQPSIKGLEDALRDGELAEVLLTLPAGEAHGLLSEAVDFYVQERATGRLPRTGPESTSPVKSSSRSRREDARSVWRLIETGDNFLKYAKPGRRDVAEQRARARYEQALQGARSLGNEDLVDLALVRIRDIGTL